MKSGFPKPHRLRPTVCVAALLAVSGAHPQALYIGSNPVARGDGSTPFTATGASSLAAMIDRATFKGVSFDARSDLGFACDGATDDTGAASAMVTKINASPYAAVRVLFPGACLIRWQNWLLTKPTIFEGIAGGGLKLAAGQTMSSYLFRWQPPTTSAPLDAVTFRNFTIDLGNNSPSAVGVTSVLNFFYSSGNVANGLSNSTIEGSHIFNVGPLPPGATFEEILGFAVNVWNVHHNIFQINVASGEGNEAFDAGSQASPIIDLDFSDNTLINTGMGVFGVGGRTTASHNRVSGWGFGAAITIEPVGYTDPTPHQVVIASNSLSNSLAAPDRLGTKLDAIESGFAGAVIANNSTYKTCGVAIGLYGPAASITGNLLGDAGTCNVSALYNSSIAVFAPAASIAAAQTLVDGNTGYDDGGGNTSYGFSDAQAVSQIELGTNFFAGSQGAYNLSGSGVHFLHPQADNDLVNPCFQADQRNAGATIVSGMGPDQWHAVETAGNIAVAQVQAQMGRCLYALNLQVATQATPGSSDIYAIEQGIALEDVRDFAYGSIYARDAVLAFCAKYSGSPPFSTSVFVQNINAGTTWTHPFSITAPANTLQCFSTIVPGDVANSLGATPTNTAFRIGVNLGSGSGKLTTAGAWNSGLSFGTTGDTALVSQTAGISLKLSDFRFLAAGADEGWAPPKYADVLADAQRFYETSFPVGTKPAQGATTVGQRCVLTQIASSEPQRSIAFKRTMITTPAITWFNPVSANSAWRDETANADVASTVPSAGINQDDFLAGTTGTVAAAGDLVCGQFTADSGLQ